MNALSSQNPSHIIVEHRETRCRFLLLSGGYGLARTAVPSPFLGSYFPKYSEACHTMVCVADSAGELGWLPSQEVRVVSIGGQSLESIEGLDDFDGYESKMDHIRSGGDLHLETTDPTLMRCANCQRPIESKVCPRCN